jgi:hypothetical protein
MTEQSFAQQGPAAGFRVGDVLSRSFSLYFRRLPLYYLIALVVTAPNLYFALEAAKLMPTTVEGRPVFPPGYWPMIGLTMLVSMLSYAIENVALIHIALQDVRGRRADPGATVSLVFARTLSILVVLFIAWFAVSLSAILLIVPAFLVWMMLSVAVPACIDDTPNPFAALGRSAELTKGNRWRLFGIQIVYIVVLLVFSGLQQGALAAAVPRDMMMLLSFPLGVALSSWGAVLSAATYSALRVAKQGVEGDQIATVFD